MSNLELLENRIEENTSTNERITNYQIVHGEAYRLLKDFILAYDDGPNEEQMLDVYFQSGKLIELWDKLAEQTKQRRRGECT